MQTNYKTPTSLGYARYILHANKRIKLYHLKKQSLVFKFIQTTAYIHGLFNTHYTEKTSIPFPFKLNGI